MNIADALEKAYRAGNTGDLDTVKECIEQHPKLFEFLIEEEELFNPDVFAWLKNHPYNQKNIYSKACN